VSVVVVVVVGGDDEEVVTERKYVGDGAGREGRNIYYEVSVWWTGRVVIEYRDTQRFVCD